MPNVISNKQKNQQNKEEKEIKHLDVNSARYLSAISLLRILSEEKSFTFILENIVEMASKGSVNLDITYTEEDEDIMPSSDMLDSIADYLKLVGYKVNYESISNPPYISIDWSM